MGDYIWNKDFNLLGSSEDFILDLLKQIRAKDKEIKKLKKQLDKKSNIGLLERLKRGSSDAKHKRGRFV